MKDLIEYLVKSLVDNPDQVNITETEEDESLNMELTVANEDLGKVIGKSGNTVNAIRTVLQAAAASRNKRAKLDVIG